MNRMLFEKFEDFFLIKVENIRKNKLFMCGLKYEKALPGVKTIRVGIR